jgi:LCP family protein required for cell wall assembly
MSTDGTESRGHDAARPEAPRVGSPASAPEPTDTPPPPLEGSARPRRSHVLRRVLISVGILGLVLAVAIGGGLWYLSDRWGGNIDRISDAFAGLDENSRPAPATPAVSAPEAPITFLLVGSDTRGHTADGENPDGRSDAIMIARFSADRGHAQLISIPRDSWVEIPGHGINKINASYAFGGPSLLIQTVENLTQVRIDHYVTIDFDGIIQVTDDLGGVDVVVAEETTNGPYTFPAGVNHLDGAQARWYLGQRYGLPGGDFDRMRRQQQYLKAMFSKLFNADTFTDVGRLDDAMIAVTRSVGIDDGLGNVELAQLAYSMRNMTPDDVDFFTAPVLGTGREGPASVVYLDTVTGERMWSYLRSDSLSQNAAELADEALPAVPR